MTGIVRLKHPTDATSQSDLTGVDGIADVSIKGVDGNPYLCCLVAKTSAPGANDVLSSATGFKLFEAVLGGAVTAGSGDVFTEMVAVAWSTIADDSTAIASILATAVAEFDGSPATPPVLLANCRILRTQDDIVGAMWDGENTIKTIGVRAVGVTPGQVDVILTLVG